MGTALTGLQIGSTYNGLLKTTDNAVVNGTLRVITDGLGNDTALSVSTAGIKSTGTLDVTGVATLGAGAILNAPASGTLTNCTGLPVASGISGFGTGVATALAVNIGSAGAPVLFNGALGTPSSGTVTNLTGTASININGVVGATTPAAGSFTTLAASGNFSALGANHVLGGTAGDTIVQIKAPTGQTPVLRWTVNNVDKWGILGNYPSAGELGVYDYVSGAVRTTFSSTGIAVTGTLSATSGVTAGSGTAITAGGSLLGLMVSSTASFGVFCGSGAPSISAAKGSLYLRSDGSSTSTRLYVNTDGGTTWTNVTTAA